VRVLVTVTVTCAKTNEDHQGKKAAINNVKEVKNILDIESTRESEEEE